MEMSGGPLSSTGSICAMMCHRLIGRLAIPGRNIRLIQIRLVSARRLNLLSLMDELGSLQGTHYVETIVEKAAEEASAIRSSRYFNWSGCFTHHLLRPDDPVSTQRSSGHRTPGAFRTFSFLCDPCFARVSVHDRDTQESQKARNPCDNRTIEG
jgi:hypothetical protein